MNREKQPLVGSREAAAIIGVRPPNFVRDWAGRPDFPAPIGRLSRGRVWERAAVERYARLNGPQRGVALRALPLSRDAASQLPSMKRRLVHQFRPERIVLFGSQVRGEAGPDSDVDLLVVMPDGIDERAAAIAMRRAVSDIPLSKDVIVTTPTAIARFGDVIGTMVQEALSSGVTIYARP